MEQTPKESEIKPFGYLLAVDLYACRSGVCDDLNLNYKFLEDMVIELKMKKQSPPFIFKSDASIYPDKAGLSGWIPLIESGVQIHTISLKNFISIDIYSCRYFSSTNLKDFIQNYFSAKEIEMCFIERGTKYNDTN
ncbi:MAG: S-adenosylmethionine decarboxylase [Patescibacteria group bacterium]